LEFRCFDLSVLETYRNDPRYEYSNDDVRGNISVTYKHFQSGEMANKDQIVLETFGFAYDDNLHRAVAVFCRYLSRLSPAHQQIWKAKQVEGNYQLHPDYFANRILGQWSTGISVCDAILEELKMINAMCNLMKRPHLFHDDFIDHRPRQFSFLVRPTQAEFNGFVLTLDKILSDNINKKFFLQDIADENEQSRGDGKVVVTQKGTILMLDEWIRSEARPIDPVPFARMVESFRKVRKLRQNPAHSIEADEFDQRFLREQRQLLIEAYDGLQAIRALFATHPSVKKAPPKIPDVIIEGPIWTR